MKRRITLELDLQADTMPELVASLRGLAFDVARYGDAEPETGHRMVSGGYCTGYIASFEVDKDMTGDKYREWLGQERLKSSE